jgi:hypothetical protein
VRQRPDRAFISSGGGLQTMFHNFLFRVVLWALGLRLRWLGNHNEKFREKLKGQAFTMQFRTFDNAAARAFRFDDGHVEPMPGLIEKPSITLSFLDSEYAMNTLMAAGKDQTAMMKGMQEQKVKIEGDYAKLMLFMQVAKYLPPQKKKKPQA